MEDTRSLLEKADAFNKKVQNQGKKKLFGSNNTEPASTRKGMAGSTIKVLVMISLFLQSLNVVIMDPFLDIESVGKSLEPVADNFKAVFTPDWKFAANSLYTDAVREFFDAKSGAWTMYLIFSIVGSIAVPLLCYIVLQEFLVSDNKRNDVLTLGMFAMASEIPYDLAVKGKVLEYSTQNLFVGIFIGVAVVWIMDYIFNKVARSAFIKYFLSMLVFILGILLAIITKTYFFIFPVLVIACMYIFREKKMLGPVIGCFAMTTVSPYYLCSFASLIPINMFNGKIEKKLKNLLPIFYPVHFIILFIVKKCMNL